MSIVNELSDHLKSIGIKAEPADYKTQGWHIQVFPEKDQVREFANVMLEKKFYLDFVSAVHVQEGFQAVYQFGNFEESCHVNAKALTGDGSVPTICDIFQGAEWHERETHDFYGLEFTGHPDLRVLILDEEDADLNPLLKGEKKLQALDGITRKEGEEEPAQKKAKAKAVKKNKPESSDTDEENENLPESC